MCIYERNTKEKIDDIYFEIINKLRCIKFIYDRVFKGKHKQLKKNIDLKDNHKNKRCFVIGNGPSINKQDLTLLKDEIVFMVNRAFLDSRYEIIKPKYHVIVDPKLVTGEWSISFLDEIAKKNPDVTFLLNSGWYNLDILKPYKEKYNIYWIDGSLTITPMFFNKRIDLTKRTYSNAVVEHGITAAIYMGCDVINIMGVDGNGLCYSLLGRTDSHSYGHNPEDLTMSFQTIIRSLNSMSNSLRKWHHLFEYCSKNEIKLNNLTKSGILKINNLSFDEYIKEK
ncbi:6-hydroxymethylpterin diphosphokinase MptE-like protein [Celerinatantimonas yamalensis]|uniref:6-hydroxymethylpterin diphosphokinase MptE-like protein n=1 Tax=Celerinatantimonas yamalensis TaxID=559956 RepID=A0ABW9G4C2_9GAMM